MSEDACFDPTNRMTGVRDAWALLAADAPVMVRSERVALGAAAGRILAEPLIAAHDVPAFDNVALDGFAFRAGDLGPVSTRLALLAGRAAAGHPFTGTVPAGHALEVLTGALLPAGTDTVAMWEDCRTEPSGVVVPAPYRQGAGRRRAGEDVRCGQTVIAAGTQLQPQHIGVAAELGAAELSAFAPLRVALLSSGDEVHEPGTEPPHGGLFDANRPMLKALLGRLPVAVTDLGILRDDRGATRQRLAQAATTHDVILATGGASRGAEDHVVASVADLGALAFWQIRMKPGRPLAIGRIGDARLVGLPGNPVAAFVCFVMFARPLLLALAGAPWRPPRGVPIPAGFTMTKRPGRTELLRATLDDGPDGLRVGRIRREGSGILTSLTDADGLALIEEERTGVQPGEPVEFLSFASLGAL